MKKLLKIIENSKDWIHRQSRQTSTKFGMILSIVALLWPYLRGIPLKVVSHIQHDHPHSALGGRIFVLVIGMFFTIYDGGSGKENR